MSVGEVGREAAKLLGVSGLAEDRVLPALGDDRWSAQLPVAALAADSVALASLAANAVAGARRSTPVEPVQVDRPRIAASFGSEKLLRIDGKPPSVWAPLSGFWPTADGWVRTHANYPHHERALRAVLGLGELADTEAVAAAMLVRSAHAWETDAAEAGAIVSMARTPSTWLATEQGRAVAHTPLIERRRIADAPARAWRGGDLPLSGLRVLDLTRVIAGPIAARDLAFAGADVLRIDSPALEETGWIHLDTGQGKRSTLLDLTSRRDRSRFEQLLSEADVLLTGYRPGALARFGLEPEALADRHRGLVTASVSAWGWTGPWAGRRGFDSIVQAATGIAMTESKDGATPGALPVQALDHATGHVLAAATMLALLAQRSEGGAWDVRMSLARTAHALLHSTDAAEHGVKTAALPTNTKKLSGGRAHSLMYAPPVLAYTGAPSDYVTVGGEWGADEAAWADRPEHRSAPAQAGEDAEARRDG